MGNPGEEAGGERGGKRMGYVSGLCEKRLGHQVDGCFGC